MTSPRTRRVCSLSPLFAGERVGVRGFFHGFGAWRGPLTRRFASTSPRTRGEVGARGRSAPSNDLVVSQRWRFQPREGNVNLSLNDALELTPETYADRFRASAMKRAKLSGLQRNARALLQSL